MEQVHYFGGLVEGAETLQTDKQNDKPFRIFLNVLEERTKKNVENWVELNEKTRLQSVLKGKLPTRSFFAF